MNRKQLRARKVLERKHALKIAWQRASTCYDLYNFGLEARNAYLSKQCLELE